MLFFSGGCWFPADLIFPLGKVTVVLFYNAFHFSESHHKNLYIGITVRFECIGDFIQPVGNLRFGFFDSYLQRFSFFTFEKPLCIGKLLFQLRQNFILQVFDFYRFVLYFYHQVSHMAELCHINIKRRLRLGKCRNPQRNRTLEGRIS